MKGGGDADPKPPVSITLLTRAEQEALIVKLTDYANYLIRTRATWTSRGILPRGHDAESLALEAIARVLDGRRRDWDPQMEPTLSAYLKSVVKSIFSSELLAAAERELAEIPSVDDRGTDRMTTVSSPNPGPDDELEVAELKERILKSFEKDEDELVLICLFEGITAPASIAAETGLEQREVYRIKQKIKRRLLGVLEDE